MQFSIAEYYNMDRRTVRPIAFAKHPACFIYALLQGQGLSSYVYIFTSIIKAFSISFNNISTYRCTVSVLYFMKMMFHESVIS